MTDITDSSVALPIRMPRFQESEHLMALATLA
jgi:hypothetical protein